MQIKEDFEIKNLTTYKIGGKVKKVYFPETQEELSELLCELDEYIILGGCSNVLFSSNGYSGNLILKSAVIMFLLPAESKLLYWRKKQLNNH